MSQNPQINAPEVASHDLFGWVECSDRLPADFDRVVIQGSGLGCFVGSLYKGVWRVDTPLNAADGRRIMIELDDSPRLPQPERWMSLPNTMLSGSEGGKDTQ